jgi:UDP-N-acetylglucosamine transferase subunit ALG13
VIFVSVGTQLPFDRLIRTVDQWCGDRGLVDVFAQIGDGRFQPRHLQWRRTLSPELFREKLEFADLVISHAGMGTILTALELGKRVIVLPRMASLGEHRNEHQLATARKLGSRGLITVADDEGRLRNILDRVDSTAGADCISGSASPELLLRLNQFITQVS